MGSILGRFKSRSALPSVRLKRARSRSRGWWFAIIPVLFFLGCDDPLPDWDGHVIVVKKCCQSVVVRRDTDWNQTATVTGEGLEKVRVGWEWIGCLHAFHAPKVEPVEAPR